MDDFSSQRTPSNEGIQPVAIVSQLLQNVATMQHIDELFAWMAMLLLQRFSVESVQLWALQAHKRGMVRIHLRNSGSQRPEQAQQVVSSPEIASLVERVFSKRQGILSVPVTGVFSQYQATALMQYNCRYWTVYFFSNTALLPPVQKQALPEEVATPLQIVLSLFTQQPLPAAQTRAITFIMEQLLRTALSRGLLQQEAQETQQRPPSQASQATRQGQSSQPTPPAQATRQGQSSQPTPPAQATRQGQPSQPAQPLQSIRQVRQEQRAQRTQQAPDAQPKTGMF